jgi:DNA replication protein DnaC
LKVAVDSRPDPSPEELEWMRKKQESQRQQMFLEECESQWRNFLAFRGRRYADCTLENFQVEHPKQIEVVRELSEYIGDFTENTSQGRGVVLFGATGTGKDHLMTALCRHATQQCGIKVNWFNGLELYANIRTAIKNDSESEEVHRIARAPLLAISDAVPPAGELSEYQASVLFRILDERYSHMRPVWMTLNVASADEAKARLTVPIVDRLRDCCLTLHCNWPSYRGKAQ